MRFLNISPSTVMLHTDLSPRTESINLWGDTSPRNASASITHHGSTMMSSSPSQDVREPMMHERGTTLMKPVLNTSLLDSWLKRAVKQAKCKKEINVARLCKTNPKGFYSYINERRIIIDNVGLLKTPTGQIVTTDKANTCNLIFG